LLAGCKRVFFLQVHSRKAPAARLGALLRRLPKRLVVMGFAGSSSSIRSLITAPPSSLSSALKSVESSAFFVAVGRLRCFFLVFCCCCDMLSVLVFTAAASGFRFFFLLLLSMTGISSLIRRTLRGRPLFFCCCAAAGAIIIAATGFDAPLLSATSLDAAELLAGATFLKITFPRPICVADKNPKFSPGLILVEKTTSSRLLFLLNHLKKHHGFFFCFARAS
jgi:hypothetical protein